jgi:hypothetical protein
MKVTTKVVKGELAKPHPILLVRHHAQELERRLEDFVAVVLAGRNVDHVTRFDFHESVSDSDPRTSSQHILLMLDLIGVAGHSTASAHDEPAHRKVRSSVSGSDQDLHLGGCSRFDRMSLHRIGVLDATGVICFRHVTSLDHGIIGASLARSHAGAGARSNPVR